MSIASSGRRFGRYSLQTQVGASSLAALYQAADGAGRSFTVHVLAPAFEPAPKLFLETLRAAARLRAPGLPRIVDFGLAGDERFWVTEPVPAETLAQRLAAGGLPAPGAVDFIAALAEARRQDPAPVELAAQDVGLAEGPGRAPQPVLLTAGLGPLAEPAASPTPAAEAAALAGLLQQLLAPTPSEQRLAAVDLVLHAACHTDPEQRFPDPAALVTALRAALLEPTALAPRPGRSVTLPAAEPRLRVQATSGRQWEARLEAGGLVIGRGAENDVVLDEPLVSRQHARVEARAGQIWVTDLGSLNGTYLGEWRLPPETPQVWKPGAVLRVGAAELQLLPPAEDATVQAAPVEPRRRSDPAVLRSGAGAGPVGVFVETPKITVAPGASGTASLTLFNDGPQDDHFIISLSGPPPSWIALPGPHHLRAGTSSVLRLLFQPPHAPTTRAGAYSVTVRVASQSQPLQVVEAQLTLTVTAFTEFASSLRPTPLAAGAPGLLNVVNTGNTPAAFSIRWEAEDELLFRPPEAELSLAEGQTGAVEFTADLRRPRWFGGARRHPFRVQVTADSGLAQTHAGVLTSTGLLPAWIVALVALLAVLAAGRVINSVWLQPAGADPAAATQAAQAAAGATLRARAAATGTALWLGADDDRDGLPNQAELAANTLLDKFDTDEDGLSDGEEIQRGTNPLRPDSDGDGLPDGEEVRRGLDPLKLDSDGDQTPDAADALLGAPATATLTPTVTATAPPAAVTLTGLSPNTVVAGGGAFVLNVSGQNFSDGLIVRWNGADRPTQFVSANLLTASLAADDIATAGPAAVTVYNPASNTLAGSPLTLAIQNPLPSISAGGLSPATALAGGQAFTLVVNGANFVNGAVVRWNGADRITAFNSRNQLVAFINAADLTAAGVVDVVVFNPSPGGGLSNAQSLTVANPLPVLTGLAPAFGLAGTAPLTLTVTGSGFVPGAVVRWNGADRPTVFVSAGRLEAALAGGDWAAVGTATVTVANPAPGGGASNGLSFPINYPSPALAALSPLTATAGSLSATLVITGTGFVNGVTTLTWNGALRPTVVISSTRATAQLGASDLAAPGTVTIALFNPTPGGGLSGPATFTITP